MRRWICDGERSAEALREQNEGGLVAASMRFLQCCGRGRTLLE